MNFAFAGAPDFAAWTLEHLVGLGRRPALVISQPDRPMGRGRRTAAPATAAAAERLGLALIQPDDINAPAVIERLEAAKADVLVVAAFGQLLRAALLDSAVCLNVHASLLPHYRGAAPIERALAAGESHTGVSIMRMEKGLDTGPWALQTSLSLSLWDDAGSVGRVLALLGAQGVDHVLTGLEDGTVVWTEQAGDPDYADKLRWEDSLLAFGLPARTVHDQVRSLSPRVGARAVGKGVRFKIWRTWPYGMTGLTPVPREAEATVGRPGAVAVGSGRLFIGCGEGVIEVLAVQPDNKSRMSTAEFLRGYRDRLGVRLETPGGESATDREPELGREPAGDAG